MKKFRIVGSEVIQEVNLELIDLVCLHLRKDIFQELRKFKLMPRATDPLNTIEKINNNAYKHELPPNSRLVPPLTFQI